MSSSAASGAVPSPIDEGQLVDRKSLRVVTGSDAGFRELAQDCVGFANAAGGALLIGIEDGSPEPPSGQRIDPAVVDRIRRRVGELTRNVQVMPEVVRNAAGDEYIALSVPRATSVASTSHGRFFLRVGDTCQPIVGDDVLRLANERPAIPWELMKSLGVPRSNADGQKLTALLSALRASDRVKASVTEKSPDELLEHYGLAVSEVLTNLGVLLLGTSIDRARLGNAPVVQAIRYDDRGEKISKHVWDDHSLSPVEVLDAVWQGVPDFRESYELPEGLFRATIPAYDEVVIRELLVNALVHRPYTQRGDIFLNLRPDRLEVVNAGRLPLGVTPSNILHTSRRRNEALARVFHDLKLMEREGSGFDLMYDRLLTSGRAAPTVSEREDSVHVVVERRVMHPGVIRLIAEADQRYQLTQRERIALGTLARSEGLSAMQLSGALELCDAAELKPWIARLETLGLVEHRGRTRATRYFVRPDLLRGAGLDEQTTLGSIEPHRLRELVLEDLRRYPGSGRADIHRRVGAEIQPRAVTRTLTALISDGLVVAQGKRRWTTYSLVSA